MDMWTLAQIRRKVQLDLDLEAEDFVELEELDGYINEAIDEAESHIHTLGLEDYYFLKRGFIQWTAGQNTFDLPTDIYAHKIAGITYNDGSTIYPLRRVRGSEIFHQIALAEHYSTSSDVYRYAILNQSPGTPAQMQIYPAARTDTTADGLDSLPKVEIWYYRQSNRLVNDDDVCDIPEFYHFVIKFTKWMVLLKEGHPNMVAAKSEMDYQRDLMIDTLSNMVPDKDSEIVPDLNLYNDFS